MLPYAHITTLVTKPEREVVPQNRPELRSSKWFCNVGGRWLLGICLANLVWLSVILEISWAGKPFWSHLPCDVWTGKHCGWLSSGPTSPSFLCSPRSTVCAVWEKKRVENDQLRRLLPKSPYLPGLSLLLLFLGTGLLWVTGLAVLVLAL